MNLRFHSLSCRIVLLAAFAAPCAVSYAAPPAADHWIGTWASSPVAMPNIRRPRPMPGAPGAAPAPVTPVAPVAPVAPLAPGATPAIDPNQTYGAADTTFREIVHVSVGGSSVRVIFTNEFGTEPLTIGAARVAPSEGGSGVNSIGDQALTFGGHSSIIIPPGALVVSDAAALKLAPGSDLAVSFFLPAQAMKTASGHGFANQTSYTAPGNVLGAKTLDSSAKIASWPFVKGVDVKATSAAGGSIVTFGDSITDGALSTKDANTRWPDILAHRLAGDKKTAELGVLNQGIGGNRILHDVTGPSALARFDRDVIAQTGAKYVIILEGINDIGHAADPVRPYDVITADDLIAGFTQMVERAHTHGIKVIGATLTPYGAAKYESPTGEAMRQTLNKWIRTSPLLDGFIDFDKATLDPANPSKYLPAYDSGDSLHPKDAGYKAMGESIDLKLFEK